MVFALLDQSTRGTICYATPIKPYARKKDGRTAYMTLISSHAGKDKWEQTQKEQVKFMTTTKWNGKSYSLEVFTGYHRSAFIQLQEASDHVNFQLPTEHSRVGYLIDTIDNPDPDLRAAIAQIRINTNNMREDFDLAVESLLPVDPYIKHAKRGGKKGAEISALKGQQDSRTGVDLRWYKPEEYKLLTKPQRIELSKWQKTKEGQAAMKDYRSRNNISTIKKPSAKSKLKAKIKALEAQINKDSPETEAVPNVSAAQIQRFIQAAVSSATATKQVTIVEPADAATCFCPSSSTCIKKKKDI